LNVSSIAKAGFSRGSHGELYLRMSGILLRSARIREAMDEGAFDHLEGAGKPLDLQENPLADPLQQDGVPPSEEQRIRAGMDRRSKEIDAEAPPPPR
jgi:Domain of unknown function (DUF1992)